MRGSILAFALGVLATASPSPAGAADLPVAGGLEDAALGVAVATPAGEASASLDAAATSVGASVSGAGAEATVKASPEAVAVEVTALPTGAGISASPPAPADSEPRRDDGTGPARAQPIKRRPAPAPESRPGGPEVESRAPALATLAPQRVAAVPEPRAGRGVAPPDSLEPVRSPAPDYESTLVPSSATQPPPALLGYTTLVALALAAAAVGRPGPGLLPPLRPSPHDLFPKRPG